MRTLGHWESLEFFLAPTVLAAALLVVVLWDLVRPAGRKGPLAAVTALALVAALAWVAVAIDTYPRPPTARLLELQGAPEAAEAAAPVRLFGGSVAYDGFGLFFQLAGALAALATVLFSWPVVRRWPDGQGEFLALLLALTLGMFLMACAQTLLLMYLSIEFSSIVAFILAGMLRRDRRSAEAALKYIIYSASASGVMLFGMSLLYAASGSLDVVEIGQALAVWGTPQVTLVVASVLAMGGFAYKIAAVPFHLWCPDVYEGAPTPVAAFFSVGPKAAGLAILARFLAGVFPESAPPQWQFAVALLAVMTMTLGNFAALWQENLKRLLAYSSIAHAGYILLAFVFLQPANLAGIAFYVLVYVVMNLGAFFVVVVLEETYGITTVEGCRGVGWRLPLLGGLMAVFLLALTGLPPTGGFVAKFMLFGSVLEQGGALGTALVVLGVLFSVVSLGYYARVLGSMYLRGPRADLEPRSVPLVQAAILWILAVAVFAFQFAFGPAWSMAADAGQRLLGS